MPFVSTNPFFARTFGRRGGFSADPSADPFRRSPSAGSGNFGRQGHWNPVTGQVEYDAPPARQPRSEAERANMTEAQYYDWQLMSGRSVNWSPPRGSMAFVLSRDTGDGSDGSYHGWSPYGLDPVTASEQFKQRVDAYNAAHPGEDNMMTNPTSIYQESFDPRHNFPNPNRAPTPEEIAQGTNPRWIGSVEYVTIPGPNGRRLYPTGRRRGGAVNSGFDSPVNQFPGFGVPGYNVHNPSYEDIPGGNFDPWAAQHAHQAAVAARNAYEVAAAKWDMEVQRMKEDYAARVQEARANNRPAPPPPTYPERPAYVPPAPPLTQSSTYSGGSQVAPQGSHSYGAPTSSGGGIQGYLAAMQAWGMADPATRGPRPTMQR